MADRNKDVGSTLCETYPRVQCPRLPGTQGLVCSSSTRADCPSDWDKHLPHSEADVLQLWFLQLIQTLRVELVKLRSCPSNHRLTIVAGAHDPPLLAAMALQTRAGGRQFVWPYYRRVSTEFSCHLGLDRLTHIPPQTLRGFTRFRGDLCSDCNWVKTKVYSLSPSFTLVLL